jgi:hypothetical protein
MHLQNLETPRGSSRVFANVIFTYDRLFQKTASVVKNCGAQLDARAADFLNFHWETANPALDGSDPTPAKNLLA